ncbi:DNA-binding protein H-NS [Loktanella fryxellensis]|uniref:DNA-binding protein H-NS n=1 Tax=Loktanella fryxellensis TaxID=245187 RepID=A0A1H8DEI7_9RHOB|nr:H-NS histone family protein [Loktanella fryxellensis]SEN05761.1 DNA-binding protein H-NS [Loktanella fryxellensis]
MNFELKSMSRKELEKLRRDVDNALEKVESRELKLAHDAAAKAAADFGFSLEEVSALSDGKTRGSKGPRSVSPAKYRNPADESQTWTGRGRQPDWYKTAMSNGTDPATLEI